MSIEERIRKLEDINAIRDLFHAYGSMLDRRDLAGYAQLFTEDGEWHGTSMRAGGGPAQILAMLSSRYTQGEAGEERHLIANPVIEVDGDRAHATSAFLVLRPGNDGTPVVRMLGEYVDELVRADDGRWLFSRRLALTEMPPRGLLIS